MTANSAVCPAAAFKALHDQFSPLLCLVLQHDSGAQGQGRDHSVENLLAAPAHHERYTADHTASLSSLLEWLLAEEARSLAVVNLFEAERESRLLIEEDYESQSEQAVVKSPGVGIVRFLHDRQGLVASEEAGRVAVVEQYHNFCEWVAKTTPLWIAAAHRKARERSERVSATLISSNSSRRQPADSRMEPSDAHVEAAGLLGLAKSREEVKRAEQLQILREEERRLRTLVSEGDATRRQEDREAQSHAMMEEERDILARMQERQRLREIRAEERAILIEHLKAEEAILRQRLAGYEAQRQADAERLRQQQALEKQRYADHLQIEQEILSRRLEEHRQQRMAEAAAAAQARAYHEAESRRVMEEMRRDAMAEASLQHSREMLRRQEEELELRRARRQTMGAYMPPPPPLPPSYY